MLLIIERDASGRWAAAPENDCPGDTVSRLVPRAASRRLRSAVLDEEMPTTPTMAAIPMAMPSADRKTRMGRDRSPEPPTRATSAGPIRAGFGRGGATLVSSLVPFTARPPREAARGA